MRRLALIVLLMSAGSFAQDAIPAGTILPVQLSSSLKSGKLRPGQTVSARLMQDVPLPANRNLPAGAKVLGHVVSSESPNPGEIQVSLRFDTLLTGKRRIPIVTNLRALATMMDVADAQEPENGPDRGTSEYSWTTDQIGGEVNYHGARVDRGSSLVGASVADGVLVRPASRPGTPCRGILYDNDAPQALWVFSSDACGLYDLPDLTLVHAGRTEPVGQITLRAAKGKLNVRSGSGMLLRVNPSPGSASN
ncbi:MAG: hypothetical protein WCF26_18360 [Candidatus Sulfotelmatobacter sp.]